MMRKILLAGVALLAVGCDPAGTPAATTAPLETASQPSSSLAAPSSSPGRPSLSAGPTASAFPTEAFAVISEDPVSAELAAELQSTLLSVAGKAGVSATVMSDHGTWSGATGKADGVRDVTVSDQFSIASITKAVAATQVMQMVEAGDLALDDPVADHLPSDLAFDTNGATIRDLLSHSSGIPDYVDSVDLSADPLRVWTPAELLAAIPAQRTVAGAESEYGNINYLLLGVVMEEVTGRPMVDVLREGVLGIDDVERLIYQPDEVPTEPIAIENGHSSAWHESMGGFLPSLALTSDGAAAAMASDSVSLAHWWAALCAGQIVSQATLTEMMPTTDWYGFGIADDWGIPGVVGHGGSDLGNNAMAGCLPEYGIAFAVLANRSTGVVDTRRVTSFLVNVVKQP
jgi:D-alanyl-D-alanine carboxypeptidase